MKILITGNNGYIGPVLFKEIKKKFPLSTVLGFDNNYFRKKNYSDVQYNGDIRSFPEIIFKNNIDTIIHLASISNDPMGNEFEKPTRQINIEASKRLIDLSKKHGCKVFIFASSCSVYGKYGNKSRDEECKTSPLTEYARSKIAIENYLKKKTSTKFKSISLRFATACGASPNLRLDLVLNDFVFSALTKKKISLNSSGNAWRPLIDVRDMSRAIIYSIENIHKTKKGLILNVGSNNSNSKIIDLAKKVAQIIKNTKIEIKEQINDNRSYKVSFKKYNKFKNNEFFHHKIKDTILNLKQNINLLITKNKNIRFNKFIRLKILEEKIKSQKLTKNLKWK